MKKIKNLQHLREQQLILEARQLQAEKNIRLRWNNLKDELSITHLAAKKMENFFSRDTEETGKKNILKSTFTYGITLLAHKMMELADEKLKKGFKK